MEVVILHSALGGSDVGHRSSTLQVSIKYEVRLVLGSISTEEELAEEVVELLFNIILSHVLMIVAEILVKVTPPTIIASDDVTLVLDTLETLHQVLNTLKILMIQGSRVEVSSPAMTGVVELLQVNPLSQITLSWEQQHRVKLVDDLGPAQDTHGEEASRDDDHHCLEQPVSGDQLIEVEECVSQLLCVEVASQRFRSLLMSDAGQETIPPRLLPPLINHEPGGEPGELEDVDAGQSYGGAHTERLQSRHLLK